MTPTCSRSFNLGHWRGRRKLLWAVRLAGSVCAESYRRGHAAGRHAAMVDDIVRDALDDPDPLFDPSDFENCL